MPVEQAYQLQEHICQGSSSPTTLRSALKAIGQDGSMPCDYTVNPLLAHFELHIEQGPRLEQEQKTIGVVHSIHEIRRYHVVVTGQRGHAGTVPMAQRADALMTTCRIALAIERMAMDTSAFATVGMLTVEEPSPNVIPGQVQFTIDLRHPYGSVLNAIEADLREKVKLRIQDNPNLKVELSCVWKSPAAQFDERAVACVESAAASVAGAGSILPMKSLAGHDSALTAMRVPTAMIFVPSQGGISHAPEEFTHKSDW
jgi:N-carbamoyl-L-amino-acid hydrolase